MIENREAAHRGACREKMAEMLRDHREHILHGLKQAKSFSLVVSCPALVRAPEVWVERIRESVGVRLDAEAMRGPIRPGLYRNRQAGGVVRLVAICWIEFYGQLITAGRRRFLRGDAEAQGN